MLHYSMSVGKGLPAMRGQGPVFEGYAIPALPLLRKFRPWKSLGPYLTSCILIHRRYMVYVPLIEDIGGYRHSPESLGRSLFGIVHMGFREYPFLGKTVNRSSCVTGFGLQTPFHCLHVEEVSAPIREQQTKPRLLNGRLQLVLLPPPGGFSHEQ